MSSAWTQGKSVSYEPWSINFHLRERYDLVLMVRRRGLCLRRLEPWLHGVNSRPSFESPCGVYHRAGLRPDPLARSSRMRSGACGLVAGEERLRRPDQAIRTNSLPLLPAANPAKTWLTESQLLSFFMLASQRCTFG